MNSMTEARTITAFFDSRGDAQDAIDRLIDAGIDRDRIRLVPGAERDTPNPSYPESGTGFWEALKDLFIPDEDRYTYAEGLRRGGFLVTVEATADEHDRALDILDDEGTIDIDERQESWRAEGWTGYSGAPALDTTAPSTSMDTGSTAFASDRTGSTGFASDRMADRDTDEEVIPVMEEQLHVGKRDVSHGRVRVRSYVVETPVTENVELRDERVRVERRPVDRAVSAGDESFRDRTIELEERGEEAVIAKNARVREELVVKKDVGSRTETVSDTVRRTEVDVDDDRGERIESATGRPADKRFNRAV
jgi:uncharacterized protein (TIGR02271 family)